MLPWQVDFPNKLEGYLCMQTSQCPCAEAVTRHRCSSCPALPHSILHRASHAGNILAQTHVDHLSPYTETSVHRAFQPAHRNALTCTWECLKLLMVTSQLMHRTCQLAHGNVSAHINCSHGIPSPETTTTTPFFLLKLCCMLSFEGAGATEERPPL